MTADDAGQMYGQDAGVVFRLAADFLDGLAVEDWGCGFATFRSFHRGPYTGVDGTPGSPTYAGSPNAALVPADQDFSGCLEIIKTTSTVKLRYMGDTPILPGCYLRVRARVKAMSGNLPAVRIAAWAGGRALARGEEVKPGFLLGTRRYECHRPWLAFGLRLRIECRCELMGDNGLGLFACRLLDGEEELAVANVSVFEPPDPDAYLNDPTS